MKDNEIDSVSPKSKIPEVLVDNELVDDEIKKLKNALKGIKEIFDFVHLHLKSNDEQFKNKLLFINRLGRVIN